MKYKYLISAVICLMLTACAAQQPAPPAEPPIEPPAITVAPIEGDAISPDGKWEVIQSGVNEGITSGGLYPCEAVKLVNRDSGEVLWEEDGAYLVHVTWQKDSKFAVVARTARTWTQVTVISTETGEACPVRLPGDEPIPEYTFLAEDWISWTDENSFELRRSHLHRGIRPRRHRSFYGGCTYLSGSERSAYLHPAWAHDSGRLRS